MQTLGEVGYAALKGALSLFYISISCRRELSFSTVYRETQSGHFITQHFYGLNTLSMGLAGLS